MFLTRLLLLSRLYLEVRGRCLEFLPLAVRDIIFPRPGIPSVSLTIVLILSALLFVTPLYGEGFSWPLGEPTQISGSFAEIRGRGLHDGIDFSTFHQSGRRVKAVKSGWIDEVYFDPVRYGKTVVIEHESGYRSSYSHLAGLAPEIKEELQEEILPRMHIQPDKRIKINRGQILGEAGDTGRGPVHLHFSLRDPEGNFVNPVGYFDPPLPYNPRPRIEEVVFIPLDGSSWVENRGQVVSVSPTREDPVTLWGRVAVAVKLYNLHPGSANRTLPYRTEIFVDDVLVGHRTFNELSPEETSAGASANYLKNSSNIGPTKYFLKLTEVGQTDSGNRYLSFFEAGNSGEIRIESRTKTGEKTSATIPYETKLPPRPHDWSYLRNQAAESTDGGEGEFVTTTMNAHQRVQKQYSPPLAEVAEETTTMDLDISRLHNRLEILVDVEGGWKDFPDLHLNKGGETETIDLIHKEPGRFIGWWAPDYDEQGWFSLKASLDGPGGQNNTVSDSVYVQAIRRNRPGAVASPDGTFSLFSDGRGLNHNSLVFFQERPELLDKAEEGLEPVSSAFKISPSHVQTTGEFYLYAFVPDTVDRPRQVGLYRWNETAERWENLTFESYTRGPKWEREARVSSLPTVALFHDQIPPEIEEVSFLSAGHELKIGLSETPSGYHDEDQKVLYQGRELSVYYHESENSLIVDARPLESGGENEVLVKVKDRASNLVEEKITVESRQN